MIFEIAKYVFFEAVSFGGDSFVVILIGKLCSQLDVCLCVTLWVLRCKCGFENLLDIL
jgi:hypothetical protein